MGIPFVVCHISNKAIATLVLISRNGDMSNSSGLITICWLMFAFFVKIALTGILGYIVQFVHGISH